MLLRVCPASQRYIEPQPDRVTAHSFSFGHHYDPENLAFGPMRAFDDHRLAWGAGFDEHKHSAVELVTWVAHGTLVHADDAGRTERLPAGTVAVQSTGPGIRHAEHADTGAEPTRFLQTWLVSDDVDAPPARYVAEAMDAEALHPVAGEGAQVPVGTQGATLWFGRPAPESPTALPVCAAHHLFVVAGAVLLTTPDEVVELADGDAARILEADDVEMTVTAVGSSAEILLWTFRSA
ncbi:pirin family protein [Nocardioides yefusunii]|uniref:Pirin family protein n=1 Tax=Nocardioides yefusunii TaxID=2500546 RepID=A0ABW1QYC5_9ACTN|nr:pirin family protein [Nocardioides yefusunii]